MRIKSYKGKYQITIRIAESFDYLCLEEIEEPIINFLEKTLEGMFDIYLESKKSDNLFLTVQYDNADDKSKLVDKFDIDNLR